MKTFLHVSPSGTIVGIHKTPYMKAAVVCKEGANSAHEIILDEELSHLAFDELAKRYHWNSGLKKK
jgi:hypothetical protein